MISVQPTYWNSATTKCWTSMVVARHRRRDDHPRKFSKCIHHGWHTEMAYRNGVQELISLSRRQYMRNIFSFSFLLISWLDNDVAFVFFYLLDDEAWTFPWPHLYITPGTDDKRRLRHTMHTMGGWDIELIGIFAVVFSVEEGPPRATTTHTASLSFHASLAACKLLAWHRLRHMHNGESIGYAQYGHGRSKAVHIASLVSMI